jgi:hypothetical protein
VVLTLLAALVFYAVVPLAGAWRLRRRWVRFRLAATEASRAPEVSFPHLQAEATSGPLRLTGTLEAFEGTDGLWIGNGQVSASVSLRGCPVYFLDEQSASPGFGIEPPRKAEAASLGALPEGTQFLVAGDLVKDGHGQVHFASVPGRPLLVLAFEGDPASVLTRAVYSGRPVVDLWNSWTPLSLGVGILLLLALAYVQLQTPGDRVSGLSALALALLPATFFLPPGILFFYGFTQIWAKGRESRAWADLTRLGENPQQPRPRWGVGAPVYETVAHGFLAVGALGNALLLVSVLRLWIL